MGSGPLPDRILLDRILLDRILPGHILNVARTIADISGQEEIQSKHVAEAAQYRGLDRNCWS